MRRACAPVRLLVAIALASLLAVPMASGPAQARMSAAPGVQAPAQPLLHEPVQLTVRLYRVLQGDIVPSIARRFHDMTWLLRRRNGGLWQMAPGALIWVWDWPFDTPTWTVRNYRIDRPQFYTVRAGDTLSAIAARMHSTVQELAVENNLGSGDLIYAGQRLVLHHFTDHTVQTMIPALHASALPTGLLLADMAALVGIDPALLKALAWHESGWTMKRGASGEIGMVQIMPGMARWVQRSLVGYPLDPRVRANNALEGALLLAYYLDANHDDARKALAMYHSGYTRMDARNRTYVQAVLALRASFAAHPRAGFS